MKILGSRRSRKRDKLLEKEQYDISIRILLWLVSPSFEQVSHTRLILVVVISCFRVTLLLQSVSCILSIVSSISDIGCNCRGTDTEIVAPSRVTGDKRSCLLTKPRGLDCHHQSWRCLQAGNPCLGCHGLPINPRASILLTNWSTCITSCLAIKQWRSKTRLCWWKHFDPLPRFWSGETKMTHLSLSEFSFKFLMFDN